MSSNLHPPRSAARRRPLLFALLVTAAFAPTGLFAASPVIDDSAPPAYPDRTHVFNGCHISTVTYLAHFAAEFPAERGEPTIAVLRNANGTVKPHTMALVTWRGEWWCRDEYFGVFSLHCPASIPPSLRHLERFYEDHARHVVRHHPVHPLEAPDSFTAEQRLHDVTTVAATLPFPNTIYWVRHGSRNVPVVFFRPAPGQVAVYDPAHGTAVAGCAVTDDARVAAAVATSLGYRADPIRADFTAVRGALVAANTTAPSVALAR